MSTLSTMQSSPWQLGLDELADFGAMRRKIVMPAIQAEGLQTLPVEKACEVLKTSFKNIFVPSDAHCEILGRCVGRISAFTSSNYPDVRTYLERINSEVKVGEYQVMCLTGVAGLGKSQLLKALERLLPAPRTIHLNDAYQAINIHFTRRAEFNVLSAARDTLRSLANPSFVANRGAIVRSELERHLRQWFYSQGVSLLVLDESSNDPRRKDSDCFLNPSFFILKVQNLQTGWLSYGSTSKLIRRHCALILRETLPN